jgi:hypothetical protein
MVVSLLSFFARMAGLAVMGQNLVCIRVGSFCVGRESGW